MKEEKIMKRSLPVSIVVIGVLLVTFSFAGIQPSVAAMENNKPGHMESSASSKIQNPEMMKSPTSGNNPGAMNNQGMGMVNSGMMRMMMSHMMGGPGKMGKMMRQTCMGMMNQGMMNREERPGIQQMLMNLDDLGLSPDQWKQVRTLAADRLDKMADLWAQQMKMQILLISLNWDEEIAPDQVKDIFVKTAEAKAEMVISSMGYMRKLKDILTQEQVKKLESD